MEPNSRAVKRRRYDSTGRRERARQTREHIVEVAEALFLAHGYASTTVTAIATRAGVSAETVYKGFGGKTGLVRAIFERGLAGQGPIPAELRSDRIRDTEPDPRRILAAWGAFVAELAPRVAPIVALARQAAGSDAEVAELLEQLDAARLERMTHNARRLRDAGHVRPGVSLEQAADVLWTYSSPELYELLVTRRGWPADVYGSFVAQAMIAALLPDGRSE